PLLRGQYLGKWRRGRRNRLSRGDRRKDALIQRFPLTQAREIRDRAVVQLTQLLQDLPNPFCELLGRRAPCLKMQREELEKVVKLLKLHCVIAQKQRVPCLSEFGPQPNRPCLCHSQGIRQLFRLTSKQALICQRT